MKTPRTPIAVQQAVIRSLREHLARVNLKLGHRYAESTLVYQQRGASAGTVWLEKNGIRLDPVLLLENQQEFIDEAVPHELARLLAWQHFGYVAPHGKERKWMMENALGVPTRRTYCFELDLVRQSAFPYRCHHQQHQLTVRRRNWVAHGEVTYRCVHCNDLLVAEE